MQNNITHLDDGVPQCNNVQLSNCSGIEKSDLSDNEEPWDSIDDECQRISESSDLDGEDNKIIFKEKLQAWAIKEQGYT
jgi:hypothetical protein